MSQRNLDAPARVRDLPGRAGPNGRASGARRAVAPASPPRLVPPAPGGSWRRTFRWNVVSLPRRWPVALCVTLGVLSCLPCVGPALGLDDYVLGLVARGEPPVPGLEQGRVDLFTFASGDAESNRALIEGGLMLPWWSDPALQVRFFRPLSSLLHRLDFWAWPGTPELMYLHSLAWLGAALAAVASLYVRLVPRRLEAGVAALLFAVNDANGAAVSWVSNRNVLIGLLLGALGLAAHHRARRAGRVFSLSGTIGVTAALGAGEIGLWPFAYLLSYALAFEEGALKTRLRTLFPYAAVLAAWHWVYSQTGAGARASGVYLDPQHAPGAFLEAFPHRALALLGGVLGPLPSDLVFLSRSEHVPGLLAVSALVLALAGLAGLGPLRTDRTLRFWALGAAFSLVPLTASFSSDRLLLPPNVGAMALVARAACAALAGGRHRVGRFRYAVALSALLVHGLLSPLALPLRAHSMQWLSRAMSDSFSELNGVEDLERKTLIVLGGPADFWVGYLQAELTWKRKPAPRQVVWLTSAESDLSIAVGERSLSFTRVGTTEGFFQSAAETLYRSKRSPLASGVTIALPTLRARVDELGSDGAPSRVGFELSESLGSERYVVLVWRGDRYELPDPQELARLRRVPGTDVLHAVLCHETLDCGGGGP